MEMTKTLPAGRLRPLRALGGLVLACGLVSTQALAAPDPQWAEGLPPVINDELRAQLAGEDFTDEEKRNIEAVLALRGSGAEPGLLDEEWYGGPVVVHRTGTAELASLTGQEAEPREGYSRATFPDLAETVWDLVAKDDRLWLIWQWEGQQSGSFYGASDEGQSVASHVYAVYVFDAPGSIAEATYRADEVDIALQLGIPIEIDTATREAYPIPPLAHSDANPDSPSGMAEEVRDALLASPDWPEEWPPILSDPELQARLAATDYTEVEQQNIKALMVALTNVALNPGGAVMSRNGMQDLARATGAVPGPGGGFSDEAFFAVNMPNAPTPEAGFTLIGRQQQIEDIIAKGDRVWMFFRWWGQHHGSWYGSEPGDDRPILGYEAGPFTFENGEIVAGHLRADELEIAQQAGIPLSISGPAE